MERDESVRVTRARATQKAETAVVAAPPPSSELQTEFVRALEDASFTSLAKFMHKQSSVENKLRIVEWMEQNSSNLRSPRFMTSKGPPMLRQWLAEAHKGSADPSTNRLLVALLKFVASLSWTVDALKETSIGKVIKVCCKYPRESEVHVLAQALVSKWTQMVPNEGNTDSGGASPAETSAQSMPLSVQTASAKSPESSSPLPATPASGLRRRGSSSMDSSMTPSPAPKKVIKLLPSAGGSTSATMQMFRQLEATTPIKPEPKKPAASSAGPPLVRKIIPSQLPKVDALSSLYAAERKMAAQDGDVNSPPPPHSQSVNPPPTIPPITKVSYKRERNETESPVDTISISHDSRGDGAAPASPITPAKDASISAAANLEASNVKKKRKRVGFKPDAILCEYRYIETRTIEGEEEHLGEYKSARDMERSEGRLAKMQMHAQLTPSTSWYQPKAWQQHPEFRSMSGKNAPYHWGSKSVEAAAQETRERSSLSVSYFSDTQIPPCPDESSVDSAFDVTKERHVPTERINFLSSNSHPSHPPHSLHTKSVASASAPPMRFAHSSPDQSHLQPQLLSQTPSSTPLGLGAIDTASLTALLNTLTGSSFAAGNQPMPNPAPSLPGTSSHAPGVPPFQQHNTFVGNAMYSSNFTPAPTPPSFPSQQMHNSYPPQAISHGPASGWNTHPPNHVPQSRQYPSHLPASEPSTMHLSRLSMIANSSPPSASPSTQSKSTPCKFHSKTRNCKFGSNCKFSHDV